MLINFIVTSIFLAYTQVFRQVFIPIKIVEIMEGVGNFVKSIEAESKMSGC